MPVGLFKLKPGKDFLKAVLDRWFDPERFRKAVLLLILALGLWMLL